ncbi:hypothetical protein [Kitasatospora purpeofusca]|uniref:hypothetical protein n=1 Tax=Kitasatospora purpeofusca TaxID=67352 RepID=UPI00366517CC
MMRRLAAVAASASLTLSFCGTAAHAADSSPAEFVKVSAPLVVVDVSDDEYEVWEATATLECPEDTVAVAGGEDVPDPWGPATGWAEGRKWVAYSAAVDKSEVPDTQAGDSVGTAYAVCLQTG